MTQGFLEQSRLRREGAVQDYQEVIKPRRSVAGEKIDKKDLRKVRPHIFFLQINEINFDYIDEYIRLGYLPTFKYLFKKYGYVKTTSETEHHLANPWIQWPTVHTGMSYAEHNVFRLGDIVKHDHEMVYEALEKHGVSVAALAAFNAKNTTKNAKFFVPDPWTKTPFTGSKDLQRIYNALCQITNDYAKEKITFQSYFDLLMGAISNANFKSIPRYIKETLFYIKGKVWFRAVICDRLLIDTFVTQCKKHRPEFATVFLNGGAHLQHHYLFSSKAYSGKRTNPNWHVAENEDPLLDILNLYDEALKDTLNFANSIENGRVIVATALHQNPHERETYYYRIDDHKSFLQKIGIKYIDTYNLMTEDFVLCFENEQLALEAEQKILNVETIGIEEIFYVETADREVRTLNKSAKIFHTENRGKDIYVQLKPVAALIPIEARIKSDDVIIDNFGSLVSLAQVKNTHHHGVGYYSDTAFLKGELPSSFPLKDLFGMFLESYGIKSSRQSKMDPEFLAAIRDHAKLQA